MLYLDYITLVCFGPEILVTRFGAKLSIYYKLCKLCGNICKSASQHHVIEVEQKYDGTVFGFYFKLNASIMFNICVAQISI